MVRLRTLFSLLPLSPPTPVLFIVFWVATPPTVGTVGWFFFRSKLSLSTRVTSWGLSSFWVLAFSSSETKSIFLRNSSTLPEALAAHSQPVSSATQPSIFCKGAIITSKSTKPIRLNPAKIPSDLKASTILSQCRLIIVKALISIPIGPKRSNIVEPKLSK